MTHEEYKQEIQFARDDLEIMAAAENYNCWLFSQVKSYLVHGQILEIGAGVGNISRLIINSGNNNRSILLEPNAVCLEVLNKNFANHPHCNIIKGMFPNYFVDRLEAHTGAYSSILMFNVLEHIENDVAALQVINELLQPGGRLLMVVPAMPSLYGEIDARLGHYRRYSKSLLRLVLDKARLLPIKISYLNFLGAIGWYFNFVLLRRSSQSTTQVKFFDKYITPIQVVTEKFFSPPFGQSLIVIAEKHNWVLENDT